MLPKKSYMFAVALLLMAACQAKIDITVSEEAVEQQESEPTFPAPDITAVQETDDQTKSVLEVGGGGIGTIYWTPADEINVFYGSTKTHYTSQNTVNATTAVFTTDDEISASALSSTNIWGLYPYNSSATCTGSFINTTLPATQYGVPGTFDDDLFITIAHNTSTDLSFQNVCGGIKFSLSRDDIASITFSGNNNETIAGGLRLSISGGKPQYSFVATTYKQITLIPKSGSTFESGEYYYIIVPPITLSQGFTMRFTTSSGETGVFNYTSSSITIKRSVFSKKANIDTYAVFPVPNNQIWYTSLDGNVVDFYYYTSGNFGANLVSNTYENGLGVMTFDGSVTKIGPNAFYGREQLSSIRFPASVTYIGASAFQGCTGLSSVYFKSSFTASDRCFYECTPGIKYYVDDLSIWLGITYNYWITTRSTKYRLFVDYNELTDLQCSNIPPGSSLSATCFADCLSIQQVSFSGAGITEVPATIFMGCSNLTNVYLSSGITSIGNYAFQNCGIRQIDIVSTISSIGESAFSNNPFYDYMGINVYPSTPPTLSDYVFSGSTCRIYIYSNYDAYYNAASWSGYRSRLIDWTD